MSQAPFTQHDTDILRRLAERKARIAQDPVNQERKRLWYQLDEGLPARPLILAEVQGVRDRAHPVLTEPLQCEDKKARSLEQALRTEIWQFETLRDDHVVEPWMCCGWAVKSGDYGVEIVTHKGDNDGQMGSRRWDPPILDLDKDFAKLQPRSFSVDREATEAKKAAMEAVFGGILPVVVRGGFWWTFGMTCRAIELVGLDNFMIYLMDNPEGIHRLMAFLRDDHRAYARWLEKEGLLTLNNGNDTIGSGSIGYTRQLPQAGLPEGAPARMKDLWLLLESQETVGVGPDQFEEFIFPYQRDLAAEFGRIYYGCCEPVHSRWSHVRRIPHLARVSVSPWCDQEIMGRELGRDYVFSRKASPTLISTGIFDEAAIRADLRKTLDAARGCRLEIIMKDVHTLNEEPGRLARWVELARAEIGA
jgi:hypothetical protein